MENGRPEAAKWSSDLDYRGLGTAPISGLGALGGGHTGGGIPGKATSYKVS